MSNAVEYLICKFKPQDRQDRMNGDGRLGMPVHRIMPGDMLSSGYSAATQWCVENLTEPGTYIIIHQSPGSSPKCKLIKLEVEQRPALRVVDPK